MNKPPKELELFVKVLDRVGGIILVRGRFTSLAGIRESLRREEGGEGRGPCLLYYRDSAGDLSADDFFTNGEFQANVPEVKVFLEKPPSDLQPAWPRPPDHKMEPNSDGLGVFSLPRTNVLDQLRRETMSSSCVIIGSPPATGKTCTLQLLDDHLRTHFKRVYSYTIPDDGSSKGEILDKLQKLVGFDLRDPKKRDSVEEDVWILIDEAQRAYSGEQVGLWATLLKSRGRHEKIKFVIATVHDVRTPGSPVAFESRPHVRPPNLSNAEAQQLFQYWSMDSPYAGWTKFSDELMRISNGHVGVIMAGIKLLWAESRNTPKSNFPSEDEALSLLFSADFSCNLSRCFPPLSEIEKDLQGDAVEKLHELIEESEIKTHTEKKEIDENTELNFFLKTREKNLPNSQPNLEKLLRRGGILTGFLVMQPTGSTSTTFTPIALSLSRTTLLNW